MVYELYGFVDDVLAPPKIYAAFWLLDQTHGASHFKFQVGPKESEFQASDGTARRVDADENL
jgi:hypothetical protein